MDDNIQRFFNAMLPGTYVRPHKHEGKNRWELFVIVRGEALVICFEDNGQITQRHILNPDTHNVAIEIPAGTLHSIAATQANTIMFECKAGPYIAMSDKDFAPWAPEEHDERCGDFLRWFIYGEIGSMPPFSL